MLWSSPRSGSQIHRQHSIRLVVIISRSKLSVPSDEHFSSINKYLSSLTYEINHFDDNLDSVARGIHPNKDVRKAIQRLIEAGWTITKSTGRSSHAWGRAHCPHGHRECLASIWSTPVNPEMHATRLTARIAACLRRSRET